MFAGESKHKNQQLTLLKCCSASILLFIQLCYVSASSIALGSLHLPNPAMMKQSKWHL
jgi:hypothetical protein